EDQHVLAAEPGIGAALAVLVGQGERPAEGIGADRAGGLPMPEPLAPGRVDDADDSDQQHQGSGGGDTDQDFAWHGPSYRAPGMAGQWATPNLIFRPLPRPPDPMPHRSIASQ